jgi:hypothetical protein
MKHISTPGAIKRPNTQQERLRNDCKGQAKVGKSVLFRLAVQLRVLFFKFRSERYSVRAACSKICMSADTLLSMARCSLFGFPPFEETDGLTSPQTVENSSVQWPGSSAEQGVASVLTRS